VRRRTVLFFFAGGAAVFGVLIARTGLGTLVSDARRTGWMFPVILVAYGLVYVCNAAAWRIILRNGDRGVSFPRAYGLTTSGFALNFLTPFLNFGGEPFRAGAAAGTVGARHAAGSVLIHNVLRALSYLLGWVTALGLALALLPFETWRVVLLAGGMLAAGGLAVVLLQGHRRDLLRRVLGWSRRWPGPLRRSLERRRDALLEIDTQVADFSRRTPQRFWQALGLEYASRWALALEYFLILVSLGQHVTYLQAFAITGLESLITTVLFFFPYEIGTKEGGLYLLFQWFGLPGQFGIYAALVSRARDLAWIALGLLLVWTGRSAPAAAGAPEQA
jgi:uncharacterized protein (TIRG00374 family)